MARPGASRGTAAAAVAVCTLTLAGTAAAAPPPTPPSAVAQYQEQLPTSTGSTSVAGALRRGHTTHLSPALVARVRDQAPSDASTLLTIAASAAPKTDVTRHATAPTPHAGKTPSTHAQSASSTRSHDARTVAAPPVAAASSDTAWLDGHTRSVLLRLGLVLLVVAVGIALVRRRRGA